MNTNRAEKEFGAEQLRFFMAARKISAAELERRTGINVSRIISQSRDFKFSTAIKLCRGLGVSLDTLAGKKVIEQDQLEELRKVSDKLSDLVWK